LVLRVLLFVRFALAVPSYVFTLAVLDGMSRSEVDFDYGMTKGMLAFVLLIGVALAIFDYYVAATLRKHGGDRSRMLVRVAAGLGFVGVLLNAVLGRWVNAAVVLAPAVAVLVLGEKKPSREWFEITQRGAKYSGG
jgi:hypothetical protein